MKRILYIFVVVHLIIVVESARYRRQYAGYGQMQQYGSNYGLYGPGGQQWMNTNNMNMNMNNRFPNQPGQNMNNNFNWNHAYRVPEWYYNSANTKQASIVCFLLCILYIIIL